jgi:hypothetical protein
MGWTGDRAGGGGGDRGGRFEAMNALAAAQSHVAKLVQ